MTSVTSVTIEACAKAPRLWVVVGATGTGKTGLSLALAEYLAAHGRPTEIVNADAMQFYRGMDIGTAKLPVSERHGVPHHLFDVLDPTEEASVAWYQPLARGVIEGILERGNDAILVGGSGLYVSSVIYNFQFPPRDDALRAQLEAEAVAQGTGALLARLAELSPETAEAVDARNPRRVVRALEVALLGGDARVTLPSEPELWRAETQLVSVDCERSELVERLDRRVDQMWAAGLIAEVKELIPHGIQHGVTASRAIGYAQALGQIAGRLSEEEAIAETQLLTRRYARRQVSWFKRYPGIRHVVGPDLEAVLAP